MQLSMSNAWAAIETTKSLLNCIYDRIDSVSEWELQRQAIYIEKSNDVTKALEEFAKTYATYLKMIQPSVQDDETIQYPTWVIEHHTIFKNLALKSRYTEHHINI